MESARVLQRDNGCFVCVSDPLHIHTHRKQEQLLLEYASSTADLELSMSHNFCAHHTCCESVCIYACVCREQLGRGATTSKRRGAIDGGGATQEV